MWVQRVRCAIGGGRCHMHARVQQVPHKRTRARARAQVGAAVSMVYASGAPIMFLGCGQTYADLKRLNVRAVVNALLS